MNIQLVDTDMVLTLLKLQKDISELHGLAYQQFNSLKVDNITDAKVFNEIMQHKIFLTQICIMLLAENQKIEQKLGENLP